MERNGEILSFVSAMEGAVTKTLGRLPLPFFSVRLKLAAHIGVEFGDITGNNLTWKKAMYLKIRYGTGTEIKYPSLQVGWTYKWNISSGEFVVTDDKGATTKTTCWSISELGICWEIVRSIQFVIIVDAHFEDDWIKIAQVAAKPDIHGGDDGKTRDYSVLDIPWSFVEKYVNDTQHFRARRLIDGEDMYDGEYICSFDISYVIKTCLYASVADLVSSGSYPTNFLDAYKDLPAERAQIARIGQAVENYELLMIKYFATIMNAGNPVLEPWMLFNVWWWKGEGGNPPPARERIFDLSPWWG